MSLSPRSRVSRGALLAVLGSLALSACNTKATPGLAVQGKEVDVNFGLATKPLERTSPQPTQGYPQAPVTQGYTALPPIAPAIDIPGHISAPPITVETCPGALETAVVRDKATTQIPTGVRPAPAAQTWVITGKQGDKPLKRAFEQRQLADVTESTLPHPDNQGEQYSFTLTEPEADGGYAKTTYQVKTLEVLNQGQDVTLFPEEHPPVGPQPPTQPPMLHQENVGPTERGLAITQIQHFDSQGAENTSARFAPPQGLLVLPLPVTIGMKFISRIPDPLTQKLWVYTAQVVGSSTIDACGELVQGYMVKGTLSINGGAETPYDLTFATQYGATPIAEHRVETIGGVTYDRTFSIGKLPGSTKVGS